MAKAVEEQGLFKPLCCICDGVRFSRKKSNSLLVILKLIKFHVGGSSTLKFASLSASFFFIYTATGYSCRSFSKGVAARKALMVSV